MPKNLGLFGEREQGGRNFKKRQRGIEVAEIRVQRIPRGRIKRGVFNRLLGIGERPKFETIDAVAGFENQHRSDRREIEREGTGGAGVNVGD